MGRHSQARIDRQARRNDRRRQAHAQIPPAPEAPQRGSGEFKPKNESQRRAHAKVLAHLLTFLLGPAGTGKTHCATAPAAIGLRDGTYKRLIVCRPNVEAGRPMGFLKGDMDEKFAPYFAPVLKILNKVLGASNVQGMIASGKIEIAPVPFLQGHTFDDAFVILDEAQNMSPQEMEMFLTRIGENSKIVVSGDSRQHMGDELDGLADAIVRMAGAEGVAVHHFTEDDIVRHGIVREVILRYRKPINDNQPHPSRPADLLRCGAA